MPNHVHALIETKPGFPLEGVVHSWKSFTSKQINKILGRRGQIWEADYFDRYIRDENHLTAVVDYIEKNPVKAGLVDKAGAWPWSSAARNAEGAKLTGVTEDHVEGTELDGVRKRHADETSALPGLWSGAQGLAEDVRYYGQWMRDEAEKRIGHLYPKIEIAPEMVEERPDLKQYEGRKLTVIAWLWARTVKSPNPAFANVDVPLVSTFMLSTKKGKEAYVKPVIDKGGYRFSVRVGRPADSEAVKLGTTAGKRQAFRCLMSGVPVPYVHIRNEGKAGRLNARLMAVVAEGTKGRVYLSPTIEHETVAKKAHPEWKPDAALPNNPRDFKTPNYGLPTFADLFTNRQLVALKTFSDLVAQAIENVERDYLAAQMPGIPSSVIPSIRDNHTPLRNGGIGATAYAEAVGVYLAFVVDKCSDYWSSICSWHNSKELIRNTFGRQAIPMVWDYAETNPLCNSTGNFTAMVSWIWKALTRLPSSTFGVAQHANATSQVVSRDKVVSTDPPYYDNVGYADLSDYFYVWLRRAVGANHPDIFATMAVPKAEELVATPYRHGDKKTAESFFLAGMTEAIRCIAAQAHTSFPVSMRRAIAYRWAMPWH